MEFSEKLNFLFELTRAEGKELASAMNVTPPQISKMRRGSRGMPRDAYSAKTLAAFFAARCAESEAQRDALAQTLGSEQLRSVSDASLLAEVIQDWLSARFTPEESAARRADDVLHQFGTTVRGQDAAEAEQDAQRNVLTSEGANFFAFYGGSGRRWAVQTFLHYLIQMKRPYTVNVLTDQGTEWILEEPSYSRTLQESMLRLTEQGCVFRRVAAPIADMDQAFESLERCRST